MANVLVKRNVTKELEPEDGLAHLDAESPVIPEAAPEDTTFSTEDGLAEQPGVFVKPTKIADANAYLARYKDSRISPRMWFALLRDLPKDYWNNLIIYMYRIYPKIMRKKADPKNPSNIGTYVTPVTERELLRAHGSGTYKIMLCDSSRKMHTSVCWCVWKTDVPFDEFPPILNLRELDVDANENRTYVEYLKTQGKLDAAGSVIEANGMQPTNIVGGGSDQASLLQFMERTMDRMLRNAQPPAKPDSELQAITKAIDLVSKGGEKATEMVMRQVGNNDPMNTVKLVEAILNTNRGDGKQAELLHSEMMDLRKQNTELMMKLIEKANIPAPDPLENLIKYKELLTALREDNEGSRPMNWKDKAIEIGLPVLGNVINVIAMAMAQKNGVTVSTQPVQQAEPGNAGELPPAQPDPQAEIRGHLNMYSPLIVRAVARGENGANFAESIVTMFGIESGVYPAIAAMGKDGILTALQSNPQAWQQLAPMAQRLDVFIDEFLAFEKEEGESGT